MIWRYISKPLPLGCGESLQITAELHDTGLYHTRVLHGDRRPVDRYDDVRNMGYIRPEEFLRHHPEFEEVAS